MLLLIALLACPPVASPPPEPTAPAAPAPPEPPVVQEPAALPAASPSAAELYTACHDRMELPEADGECNTNADCAPIGCGGEVCAKAGTTGLMFTCEDRPCFHVVEACGCHAGRCNWSLSDDPPERRMIIKKAVDSE